MWPRQGPGAGREERCQATLTAPQPRAPGWGHGARLHLSREGSGRCYHWLPEPALPGAFL